MNRKKREFVKIGEKYNRLLVIEYCGTGKYQQSMFKCVCDCGNTTITRGTFLTRGITKSCGCLQREHAKRHMDYLNKNGKRPTQTRLTHGKSKTKIYKEWCLMKARCCQENRENYQHYGGRGISVCEEWNNDFVVFYHWAINNGYDKNLEIDRINNDEGYSPINCKWSTRKEQMRNRRNTVFLENNGIKKPLAQWCEEKNIRYKLAHARMKKGYSFENIFKPVIATFTADTEKK